MGPLLTEPSACLPLFDLQEYLLRVDRELHCALGHLLGTRIAEPGQPSIQFQKAEGVKHALIALATYSNYELKLPENGAVAARLHEVVYAHALAQLLGVGQVHQVGGEVHGRVPGRLALGLGRDVRGVNKAKQGKVSLSTRSPRTGTPSSRSGRAQWPRGAAGSGPTGCPSGPSGGTD